MKIREAISLVGILMVIFFISFAVVAIGKHNQKIELSLSQEKVQELEAELQKAQEKTLKPMVPMQVYEVVGIILEGQGGEKAEYSFDEYSGELPFLSELSGKKLIFYDFYPYLRELVTK